MHATLARLEADRQESLAIINLYLQASVGVGEHPEIVKELVKATQRLATAEECIETLNRNFIRSEEETKEVDHE